jgi:serine/threonine protein kinase
METILKEFRGGFGKVEIVQLGDGSVIARKRFDPSSDILNATSIDKLRRRFKLEVLTQSKLSKDFTVPILASSLDSDDFWFTMPNCERNFFDEITAAKNSEVIPKEALGEILNSLEEVHSLGYVHRDLKPQNILLHDGKWKLSDFGLVLPPDGEVTKITTMLSAWGTESYCAPEQIQNFSQVTTTADIYAFGCILHDIFGTTSRVPYGRHTCDGPVGVIIERCTESRPERRFQDVRSLRSALFTVLASPIPIRPSVEAEGLAAKLERYSEWSVDDLREFVGFIVDPANEGELWSVLKPLDEHMLDTFHTLDQGYCETVKREYCEWVKRTSFDYGFCDVVVNRLEVVASSSSLEVTAGAIMAIARLAKKHNRWYVMRRLIARCGEQMDPKLAERIGIEIQVADVYWDFIDSAERLDRDIDVFHPAIWAVLNERKFRYRSP